MRYLRSNDLTDGAVLLSVTISARTAMPRRPEDFIGELLVADTFKLTGSFTARSMVSFGTFTPGPYQWPAQTGVATGVPTTHRAETVISLMYFVHIFDFFDAVASFVFDLGPTVVAGHGTCLPHSLKFK